MREIKFRAWDKELKRMFKVAELNFSEWWVRCAKPEGDPKENGGSYYGERNSFKNEETDRHILMQYSGKTDKNKRYIYEGDILASDTLYPYASEGIRNYYGEVYFDEDSSTFAIYQFKRKESSVRGISTGNTEYLSEFELKQLEVIGNIYETPELVN